jgi:hypothetical protein
MSSKKAILASNPPGNLANVCLGERTMCWIRKHSLPAVFVAWVAFTGVTEVHSQGTSATSTAPGLDSLITQAVIERLQLQSWKSWVSASVATLLGALLGGFGGFGIGYLKKRAELVAVNHNFTEALNQLKQQTQSTEDIRTRVLPAQTRAVEDVRLEFQKKIEDLKTTVLPEQTRAVEAVRYEFTEQAEQLKKGFQHEITQLGDQLTSWQHRASFHRETMNTYRSAMVAAAIQVQLHVDTAIKLNLEKCEIGALQRKLLVDLGAFRFHTAMLRGAGGIEDDMREELDGCAASIEAEWDALMHQCTLRVGSDRPPFEAEAYEQVRARLKGSMTELMRAMEKLPSRMPLVLST